MAGSAGGLHRPAGRAAIKGKGDDETLLQGRTVWVYYLNQKMEITDKFEDGVCFVQLKADGQTQYITVKYQNGYATSPDGYIQPDKFN